MTEPGFHTQRRNCQVCKGFKYLLPGSSARKGIHWGYTSPNEFIKEEQNMEPERVDPTEEREK